MYISQRIIKLWLPKYIDWQDSQLITQTEPNRTLLEFEEQLFQDVEEKKNSSSTTNTQKNRIYPNKTTSKFKLFIFNEF